MIIPCTQVVPISESKGRGVVATAPIRKGTITWVFDQLDREFTPEQFWQLPPAIRETILTYSYRNRHGRLVFCWDNERYMNHSFHANCCLTPYNFEIAIRDIACGEELTNDYGTLNIIAPFPVEEEGSGRDTVHPDDLRRHSGKWDRLLAAAFTRLLKVDQPLQPFFSPEAWQEVAAVASGKKALGTIADCLCLLDGSPFLVPPRERP